MTCQVTSTLDVDCSDLLDEHPGGSAGDVDLGGTPTSWITWGPLPGQVAWAELTIDGAAQVAEVCAGYASVADMTVSPKRVITAIGRRGDGAVVREERLEPRKVSPHLGITTGRELRNAECPSFVYER